MKKLLINFTFLLLFTFLSCKKTDHNDINNTGSNQTQFDWLVGNWIRTNEKDGKKTFESWTKSSNSKFLGVSYTLQNNDTIWKEDVVLRKSNNIWYFAVTGKEDKSPVLFKLSKIDDKSFVFENKKNSFPKLIQYQNIGDKFKATVSGDEMVIHFEFEKKD